MNKTKRNIYFFMLAVFLLAGGFGFCENAYAEWEKDGNRWKYIGDNGYETGWEQIEGKWYCFNLGTGIMKIGWVYDEQYNKWYCLNYNGELEVSKTTSTYPVELSNIQNKIKQYINEEIEYKDTRQVDSNTFICFTSKNAELYRQYYYHISTGNVFEFKNGLLLNLATKETFNIFTEEQAVQVVRDYLSKNNKYITQNIKVESDKGNSYLIHCYDDSAGYTVNDSWYYVNKDTRDVASMV